MQTEKENYRNTEEMCNLRLHAVLVDSNFKTFKKLKAFGSAKF